MKLYRIGTFTILFLIASGLSLVRAASLPVILTPPTSQSVITGESASFSVTAKGKGLSYQWQKNGRDLYGATGSTYVILMASPDLNGTQFACLVKNAAGQVKSQTATLTVYPPGSKLPVILKHPRNVTAVEGAYALFKIAARGESLSYQWQRNGKDIYGATGSTYTILLTSREDDGSLFQCQVKNPNGTVISETARLSVVPLKPAIIKQPQSVTVMEQTTARFEIKAAGDKIVYQWMRNGKKVTGATRAVFTVKSCRYPYDGDVIQCRISNAHGEVLSKKAILSVFLKPPRIVSPPRDESVNENATAEFSITAQGTDLSYQWLKNGRPIEGATSKKYTTPATRLEDNGLVFACTVTNSGGVATSKTAILSVSQNPPMIIKQPENLSVLEGEAAEFIIEATGSGLSYQWEKISAQAPQGTDQTGETALPESQNNTYCIDACRYQDDGTLVKCIVSNPVGRVESVIARLHVGLNLPQITHHPESIEVKTGESAAFKIVAEGSQLAFQWQHDGIDISGADADEYRVASTQTADQGRYQCQVCNSAGSVLSNPAELTFKPDPPQIEQDPQSRRAPKGRPVTLTVKAKGQKLSYQWQKNNVDLQAATDPWLTLYPQNEDDKASFRCVVFNSGGRVVSRPAVLTLVNSLPQFPVIVSQPMPARVLAGQSAEFKIGAAGSSLRYQWQKEGINIPGATDATYAIEASTLADMGEYRCLVKNESGELQSQSVQLTVLANNPPVIIKQPESVSVNEGAPVVFTVSAQGPELTYQWQIFDYDIEGATDSTLTIPQATMEDHENRYTCIVSNFAGRVRSREAALYILQDPSPELILSQGYEDTVKSDTLLIEGQYKGEEIDIVTINVSSGQYPEQRLYAELTPEGDFSCDVPVQPGTNRIEITATDSQGRQASKTIEVLRETVAEQKMPTDGKEAPDGSN